MMLGQTVFLLVLLQIAVSAIEDDNIALPQEEARQFVLPAHGLRRRPDTVTGYSGSFDTNAGIGTKDSHTGGRVVGNLLPLEPHVAMPQVQSLDVACEKQQMTVRITFDKSFAGVIYSKGHYGDPACQYVLPGSGAQEVSFVVGAEACGTQFVVGPIPYLENIVIIQNEPGIQEVWDTARGVRCVFDAPGGRETQQIVKANFNVANLDHQMVSFSADSKAAATLDIQLGRGPFAKSAQGLVKIGELMTLVVSVEGPKEADLLVRECVAHDGSTDNTIQLTDNDGCVIKKKIIGSWQKTKETREPGVSVMAYAHFQAFKFPDKLDVFMECRVDLCSGKCPICPKDQVRQRRAILPNNKPEMVSLKKAADALEQEETSKANSEGNLTRASTVGPVRLLRRLRVLSPEDISGEDISTITLIPKLSDGSDEDVCVSVATFVSGLAILLLVLVLSSVVTAAVCVRVRTIPSNASTYPPDSSFHAFSTITGKSI